MRPGSVRIRLAVALACIIATIGFYITRHGTVHELADRDLDMAFIIFDADTHAVISDASIELIILTVTNQEISDKAIYLTTDDKGCASFFRAKNPSEAIFRPFRKSVLVFDLSWASLNIRAKGYAAVEGLWLPKVKYKNKGMGVPGGAYRLDFRIPLHKG